MMLLLILMLMVLCWEDHLGEAPIKKLATAAAAATLPWSWSVVDYYCYKTFYRTLCGGKSMCTQISHQIWCLGPGGSFHRAINCEFRVGYLGPLDNGGIKSLPLKRDMNPDKAEEIWCLTEENLLFYSSSSHSAWVRIWDIHFMHPRCQLLSPRCNNATSMQHHYVATKTLVNVSFWNATWQMIFLLIFWFWPSHYPDNRETGQSKLWPAQRWPPPPSQRSRPTVTI